METNRWRGGEERRETRIRRESKAGKKGIGRQRVKKTGVREA